MGSYFSEAVFWLQPLYRLQIFRHNHQADYSRSWMVNGGMIPIWMAFVVLVLLAFVLVLVVWIGYSVLKLWSWKATLLHYEDTRKHIREAAVWARFFPVVGVRIHLLIPAYDICSWLFWVEGVSWVVDRLHLWWWVDWHGLYCVRV